jgi:hypothetical protein
MTENEKLRALLAEARVLCDYNVDAQGRRELRARIDAALAEPVVKPKRIDAHDALYRRICEDREFWENYERERDESRAEVKRAYQRGAEAMREAAAINCAGQVCAAQIRALPVPEDKR